jgi:hypothetical protein
VETVTGVLLVVVLAITVGVDDFEIDMVAGGHIESFKATTAIMDDAIRMTMITIIIEFVLVVILL